MVKEDFKIDSPVTVKKDDGTTMEGTLKGVFENTDGTVQANIEYLTPIQNPFPIENVTLKTN